MQTSAHQALESVTDSQDPSEQSGHTASALPHAIAVVLLTTIGAVFILLMAFFTERQWGVEERTLYNIPYEYVHEGRLEFPVYGNYDRLYTHPPTHYLDVALLMKAGLPLYYAEATPAVLWAIVCLLVIATARFTRVLQLGLLTGVISGVGWVATLGSSDYGFHLRPDAHMAFALLRGFLALAASQAQDWEYKRLFLGSFLLVYGSTVHYPGGIAWTGIAAFLFVAFRSLPFRQFVQRAFVAAVAGSLAGIPYVVFQILPNRYYLKGYSSFISLSQIIGTMRLEFPVYRTIAQMAEFWRSPFLFYAWPLKEELALSVPPFLMALALLFWHKQLRVLAVAFLPFSLFVFAILARKIVAYLYLELVLVIIGTWLLIAWLWTNVATMVPGRLRALSGPLFAILFLIAFWRCTPELTRVEWKLQRHEFGFIRARAKEIMGPNATVTSIHPGWYFSGGAHWFDLSTDLLTYLTPIDLRTYFSRFDGVAVFNMAFYGTSTGINEASLYEKGILQLRGFMESRIQPASRWVWISARHDKPVSGFFWKDQKLFRFREMAEGRHMLASLVVSGEVQPFLSALSPLQFWALDLPKAASETKTRYVLIMLLDDEHYKMGTAVLTQGRVLEVIHGKVEGVDAASLPFADEMDPISISRTYPELLALIAKPSKSGTRQFLELKPEARALVRRNAAKPAPTSVMAKPVTLEPLAIANLPELPVGQYYRVSFDINMNEGGVATLLVQDGKSTPLASLYRDVALKHASESFVFQSPGTSPLHLVLTADNPFRKAAVRFYISDPVLEQVDVDR